MAFLRRDDGRRDRAGATRDHAHRAARLAESPRLPVPRAAEGALIEARWPWNHRTVSAGGASTAFLSTSAVERAAPLVAAVERDSSRPARDSLAGYIVGPYRLVREL